MVQLKIFELTARSGDNTSSGAMSFEGTVTADQFEITHLEFQFGATARKVVLIEPQVLTIPGALPDKIEELFFKAEGQTLTLRVDLSNEPGFAQDLRKSGFAGLRLGVDITQVEVQVFLPGIGEYHSTELPFVTVSTCFDLAGEFNHSDNLPGGGTSDVTLQTEVSFCTRLAIPLPPSDLLGALGNVFVRFDFPLAALSTGWRTFLELFPQVLVLPDFDLPDLPGIDVPAIDLGWSIPIGWLAGLCNVAIPDWLTLPEWDFSADLEWFDLDVDLPAVSFKPTKNKLTLKRQDTGITVLELEVTAFELRLRGFSTILPDNALFVEIAAQLNGTDVTYSVSVRSGFTLDAQSFALPLDLLEIGWEKVGFWLLYQLNSTGVACFGAHLEVDSLLLKSTFVEAPLLEGHLRLVVLDGSVVSHASHSSQWRLGTQAGQALAQKRHTYFSSTSQTEEGTDYGIEVLGGDVTEEGRVRLVWKEASPWRWLSALGADIFGSTPPGPVAENDQPRYCALDIFKVEDPQTNEKVFQARFDWADDLVQLGPAVGRPDSRVATDEVCFKPGDTIQYPVKVTNASENKSQTQHKLLPADQSFEKTLDLPGFALFVQPPSFHSLILSQEADTGIGAAYIVTYDMPPPQVGTPISPLISAQLGFSTGSGSSRQTLGGTQNGSSQPSEPFAELALGHLGAGRVSLQVAGYTRADGLRLMRGRRTDLESMPVLLNSVEQPSIDDEPRCPGPPAIPPEARAIVPRQFSGLQMGGGGWAVRLNVPALSDAFGLFGSKNSQAPVTFELTEICINPEDTSAFTMGARLGVTLLDFKLEGDGALKFDLDTGAVKVDFDDALSLVEKAQTTAPGWLQKKDKTFVYSEGRELFGQNIVFRKPKAEDEPDTEAQFLQLVIADGQFQLEMLPDVEAFIAINKFAEAPIVFRMRDVSIGTEGFSFATDLITKEVKFEGLNAPFIFETASLEVSNNKLVSFNLDGSTTLPKDILGGGEVGVTVVGTQNADNDLEIASAGASLKGDLLKIEGESVRFNFELTEVGLFYQKNPQLDRPQFYFEITGSAMFRPNPGEFTNGLLGYFENITITFDEMRLTDEFIEGLELRVELKKPIKFGVFGLFEMEIRSFGIAPKFEPFNAPALMIGGKVEFSLGEDLVDADIKFHTLYLGPQKPGEFLPQVHFKGLRVEISTAEGFRIAGRVDTMDNDNIKGFGGEGLLEMPSFPAISAAFTFVRIKVGDEWKHAWFIAIGLNKVSFGVQPIPLYLRAIRVGFGHRFQLKLLDAVDQTDDPKTLINLLTDAIAKSPAIDRLDAWVPDFAKRNRGRNMIVIEADLTLATANSTPLEYNAKAERKLGNVTVRAQFIFRDDGTFIATFKGWVFAPYDYILEDKSGEASRPSLAGFALISSQKEMFLFHARSLENAYMGPKNLPVPEIVKDALRAVQFDATILATPRVLHAELGWPDRLIWGQSLGPLSVSIRGGVLLRVEDGLVLYGSNFIAQGRLSLSGGFSLGFIGVRIEATASVGYGQQLMALVDTRKPLDSKVYAAVGIDIRVSFRASAYLRFKAGFVRITWRISFSFDIQITAGIEFGAAGQMDLGMRARAYVSVGVFGRRLGVRISLGVRDGAVDRARQSVLPFMNSILEPDKPIPTIPGLGPERQAGGGNNLGGSAEFASALRPGSPPTAPDIIDVVPFSETTSDGITTYAEAPAEVPFAAPLQRVNWRALSHVHTAADANQGRTDDKVWLVWIMPGAEHFLPILDPREGQLHFKLDVPTSDAKVYALKKGAAGPVWSEAQGAVTTPYVDPLAERAATSSDPDAEQQRLKLFQMLAGTYVPNTDASVGSDGVIFPYNLAETSSKDQIEGLIDFGAILNEGLENAKVVEDSRRLVGGPLNPNATLDLEDTYDKALQQSVSEPDVFSSSDDWGEIYREQAITTRNLLMQEFAGAHEAWAEWVKPDDISDDKPVWRSGEDVPLLFATGLVLAIKGKELPAWVKSPAATDMLRIAPALSTDDDAFDDVPAEAQFDTWSFKDFPPIFRDISTYYDEEQIAVRWNLRATHPDLQTAKMPEVEAMLRHYLVEVVRDDGETVVDTIKAKPTATVCSGHGQNRLLLSKAQFCMPTADVRRLMRTVEGTKPPRFYLNMTPIACTGERGLPITIEMNFEAIYTPLPAQDPQVKQTATFENNALTQSAKLYWQVPLLPESGQATPTQDWQLILRPLRAVGPARFPLSDEDAQTNGLATQAQSDILPGDLIITLGKRVQVEKDTAEGDSTEADKRGRFIDLWDLLGSDNVVDFFARHVRDHEGGLVAPGSQDGLALQSFLGRKGVYSEHGRKWLFRLRPVDRARKPGTAVNCPIYLETRNDAPKDQIAVEDAGALEPVTERAEFRPLTRRVVPAFEWPDLITPDEKVREAFAIKQIVAGQGPLYRPSQILGGVVGFEPTPGDALYTTLSFALPQAPAAFEGVYIEKRKFFAEVNEAGAGHPAFRANPLLPLRSSHEARLLPDTMAKTMDWTTRYPTSQTPLIEASLSVKDQQTKTRHAYYADRNEEGDPTGELMLQWPDAMQEFAGLTEWLEAWDLSAAEVLREGASEAQVARARAVSPENLGQVTQRTLLSLARLGFGASVLDAQAHPFLALIVGALRKPEAHDQKQVQVQTQPPASDKNTLASAWMRATAEGGDPYGWAVLAHLGLGMTLRLRNRWSQTLLTPRKTLSAIEAAITLAWADVAHLADAFPSKVPKFEHLNLAPVIEQPLLRARALKATEGPLDLDDLGLYMVQVSLRPYSQSQPEDAPEAYKDQFKYRFKPHLRRRFDATKTEVDEDLKTLDVYAYTLWSRRFFQHGLTPGATQSDKLEVMPTYLSSPMSSALVPDSSNTVTFIEEIPDQWATQLQYRVRMQGRYDALRMSLTQDRCVGTPWTKTDNIPLPRRVPVAPVQVLAVRRQISTGLRPTYHVVRKEHQNEVLSEAGQRQTYAVQNGASWIGFLPQFRYQEMANDTLGIMDAVTLPDTLRSQEQATLADILTPDPLRNALENVPLARYGATEIASFAPAFYYSSSAALFASADGKTSDLVTVALPNVPALTAPQPAPDEATVARAGEAWPWSDFEDMQQMEDLRADWAQHFNELDSYAPTVSVHSVRVPRLFESLPLDQRQAGGWLHPETRPVPQTVGTPKYPAGFVPDPEVRLDLVVTHSAGEAVFATLKGIFGSGASDDGTLFELGVLQPNIAAALKAPNAQEFAATDWPKGIWAQVGILPITSLTTDFKSRERLKLLQTLANSGLRGLPHALPLVKLLLRMRIELVADGALEDVFEFFGLPVQSDEMRRLLTIALDDAHFDAITHVPDAMNARIAFRLEAEDDVPATGAEGFELFVEETGSWVPQDGAIVAGTPVIILGRTPDLSALEGLFNASKLDSARQLWTYSYSVATHLVGQITRAEAVRAFAPEPSDTKAPQISWFALRGALPRNLWGMFDDE